MSFEQSTPINLQLSNNSLEISNSQISKNQTPLSPSNQTTPPKFFQNDKDLIFLNKNEININKTENKIISPTISNLFTKIPFNDKSNYISFCYTKLPRGGIVTFPSLKQYGTNENDPRNQKLYMTYIKNCIIKIQRNVRKFIHVIKDKQNFNNGGIVDLFHRSKSLDTIYYRRNKNLRNNYDIDLLNLELYYLKRKIIKPRKVKPIKMTKEYKTNYADLGQKIIANTFKLKSSNNLLKNKQNMLKRQIADLWIEECVPDNLDENSYIPNKKKLPKFKIQNVESFKLKPSYLLYSTGCQTYGWEESNKIIKQNIEIEIDKIKKESYLIQKNSFKIDNDPFCFNRKILFDEDSKIDLSFDKIDRTLLYRITFGNFFSFDREYERRIWDKMTEIENPINLDIINKGKSIFYSVNSTNNIDYEIQIGKTQKEIMYTLTKKDISYIWNRSNEPEFLENIEYLRNEEGDKLTFRDGDDEPIPQTLEIKPKVYSMETAYNDSISFKKNTNLNSFGTQYENNAFYYIEKFNFSILYKMKNMFESTVINSIEPIDSFNFYDKQGQEVNLEINKVNISGQENYKNNYKTVSKKSPLNINYDVDTPPIKESLYTEEEIPNYMIKKWNRLNRFSPRTVIYNFVSNIKKKIQNNKEEDKNMKKNIHNHSGVKKMKNEIAKRDSFSLYTSNINPGYKNSNIGNFNYIEEATQYNLKDLNLPQQYIGLSESSTTNQLKNEHDFQLSSYYNNKSTQQENSVNSFSNIKPTNIQNDEYIEQIKINLMKSVNIDKLKNSRINYNYNTYNNNNNNNINNNNLIKNPVVGNSNYRKNNPSKSPGKNIINKGNGKNKNNINGINTLNMEYGINGNKK